MLKEQHKQQQEYGVTQRDEATQRGSEGSGRSVEQETSDNMHVGEVRVREREDDRRNTTPKKRMVW